MRGMDAARTVRPAPARRRAYLAGTGSFFDVSRPRKLTETSLALAGVAIKASPSWRYGPPSAANVPRKHDMTALSFWPSVPVLS